MSSSRAPAARSIPPKWAASGPTTSLSSAARSHSPVSPGLSACGSSPPRSSGSAWLPRRVRLTPRATSSSPGKRRPRPRRRSGPSPHAMPTDGAIGFSFHRKPQGETVAKSKPAYLGLLNAISVAERGGHQVLDAWASTTKDKKLAKALSKVAARECDHHELFKARIEELGFSLREPEVADARLEKSIAFYGSKKSDKEKAKRSQRGNGDGGDVLAPLVKRMNEPDVDTVTKHLLMWFVDEERDSGKRLRKAYARAAKG